MDKNTIKIIGKVFFILLLIFILLYVLVWAGNIRCSKVPGMCSVYWGSKTMLTGIKQPSVMIIYDPQDKQGIGNPYLLEDILMDKENIGINPQIRNIRYLSPDVLDKTSLLIVLRAQKISTQNLETFIDYVNKGGRLVWIGDAGTKTYNNDQLATVGEIEGTTDSNTFSGWARVNNENMVIRFDKFLGVKYLDNYCNIKECEKYSYEISDFDAKSIDVYKPENPIGNLVPSSSHSLVYGMKNNLELQDNFSLVERISNEITPLRVDFGSNIFTDNQEKYNDIYPLIITKNKKIAYYAVSPESFGEPDDKDKYLSVIENMIDGMVR